MKTAAARIAPWRTLRARLMGYGLLVVVVALGVLALVLTRGTREEVRRFVLAESLAGPGERGMAVDGLRAAGTPTAIGADRAATLERGLAAGRTLAQAAAELPSTSAARVLVLDSERRPIAGVPGGVDGLHVGFEPDGTLRLEVAERGTLQIERLRTPLVPVRDTNGAPVGSVVVLPPAERAPAGEGGPADALQGSLGRWLLVAAAAAAAVALAVGALLARRISAPLEALTVAAGRLRSGDRSSRVPSTAPGEVGALARAFNELSADLERTEALRRRLVSDVAHELRTPLTRLRGQIESLRDGLARPDAGLVESLYEEALLLQRLVEDVQQLALADAEGLPLRRGPVAADELLRQSASAATAQARAAGVELGWAADPGLVVDGDRERLAQVLGNLVSNALAHARPGGHVRLTARGVELADGGPTAIELAVADDGSGIAPEHVPFVFERFYRTDEARARRDGGSGLGLAIVRQIAEAHGGSATLASAPGVGTTVTVRLPAARRDGERPSDRDGGGA